MSSGVVRVAIVEDHPLYRETIISVISATDGLEVLFGVDSIEAALRHLEDERPDLALIDLWLHGSSGLDLVGTIGERWPDVRSIVVSGHRRQAYAEQALSAGARGYILKGDPGDFLAGIEQVLAGGIFVSEAVRGAAR